MRRAAVEDALGLLDRALDRGDRLRRAAGPGCCWRAARSTRRGRTYAAALADIDEALALARSTGDRRLEMAALRARGGDAPVALRLHRRRAGRPTWRLGLAAGRRAGRPARRGRLHHPADDPRGQPAAAGDRARPGGARAGAGPVGRLRGRAGARARRRSRPCWAYLGDAGPAGRGGRRPRAPAAAAPRAHLAAAVGRVRVVVRAGRRGSAGTTPGPWSTRRWSSTALSGYPAYAGYFAAHHGWFARLAGDLDDRPAHRPRAPSSATSPVDHPWWYATAAGLLAATLVETGDRGRGRGRRAARAGATGAAAHRRRGGCAAWPPLAAADRRRRRLARPRHALLDGVECPPGQAWVTGADCYLLVAAPLDRGDSSRGPALAPLRERDPHGLAPCAAVDALLAQSSSATS